MAFYVPLGPRGFLFNLGTLLIGIFGGWVYWRASRRRSVSDLPLCFSFDLSDLDLLPMPE
jgi:hypothetical protein